MHSSFASAFLFAFLLLFICHSYAWSQDGINQKCIFVTGRTYGMDSLEVLPFVSVEIHDGAGLISDQNGYFELDVCEGDSLVFSHVGYRSSAMELPEASMQHDTLYLEIFLARTAYELPEVTIFPYKDYHAFKHAFMQLETDQTNIRNFNENVELLMTHLNNGYIPDLDGYSNYRNMMMMKDQNNNAFIFISTDPGKGILPVLMKVIKGELFQ